MTKLSPMWMVPRASARGEEMTYIRNPHDPFIWESDGEYEKRVSSPPAQATVNAAASDWERAVRIVNKHVNDCNPLPDKSTGPHYLNCSSLARSIVSEFEEIRATKPTAPPSGPTNCKHCGYPMSQHTTNAGCNLAPTAPCPLVEKWRKEYESLIRLMEKPPSDLVADQGLLSAAQAYCYNDTIREVRDRLRALKGKPGPQEKK